tara:strand:- start:16630 stop:17625 length:996 start_codon:yes stop_codon:yes gene_type:complete
MKTQKLKLLFTLAAFIGGTASASALDFLAPMEGPDNGINLHFTQDASYFFDADLRDGSIADFEDNDEFSIFRAKSALNHRSELFQGTFDVEGYYEFSRYNYNDKNTSLTANGRKFVDDTFDAGHRIGIDGAYHHHIDQIWGLYARGILEGAAMQGASLRNAGRFAAEGGMTFAPNPNFMVSLGLMWFKFLNDNNRLYPTVGFSWTIDDRFDFGMTHSLTDITLFGHLDTWMDGRLVFDLSVAYQLRQYRVSDSAVAPAGLNGGDFGKGAMYHRSWIWTLGATHQFNECFFIRPFVQLSTLTKLRFYLGGRELLSTGQNIAFGLGMQGGIRW